MATRKFDFPVANIRRYLEPGPIVLVSSAWRGENNIMTMGWHTVLEFVPSLVGCVISSGNHSFDLVRRSGECAINVSPASTAPKSQSSSRPRQNNARAKNASPSDK